MWECLCVGGGRRPASRLPPGCSLIDGPPLGEWQAPLVRQRRPAWQLALLLVAPCVGVPGRWPLGPQDPITTALARFAGARSERPPPVCSLLHISSLAAHMLSRKKVACHVYNPGFSPFLINMFVFIFLKQLTTFNVTFTPLLYHLLTVCK